MDWTLLFSMQKELDQYISRKHDLADNNLFEEKFLALLVELGELANETRCFKFWSTKEGNKQAVILEEYVDNIHFLLSIGLDKGYSFNSSKIEEASLTKTEQFNYVFTSCIHFYENQTEENYDKMFNSYLKLATVLGFTQEDIQRAYEEKNEINYERQDAGY